MRRELKRARELIYSQILGGLIREDYGCAGYLCHALHAIERGDMTSALDWIRCSAAPASKEIIELMTPNQLSLRIKLNGD